MIRLGHKYRNVTRHQVVEVTQLERGRVCYKVIIGNSDNIIREFYCSFERFLRLYELD